MEQALRQQIRHEYNKTGRYSNVTNIEVDHVTIVLDLIQVKVDTNIIHKKTESIYVLLNHEYQLQVDRGRAESFVLKAAI